MIHENNQHDLISSSTNNEYHITNSSELKRKIVITKIYPSYMDDINTGLTQRKVWSTLFSICSTLTIVAMLTSAICSFSVPQFPKITHMNYIAGVLTITAIVFERFSHYCSAQANASTQQINTLLKSLGINETLQDNTSTEVLDSAIKNMGNLNSHNEVQEMNVKSDEMSHDNNV